MKQTGPLQPIVEQILPRDGDRRIRHVFVRDLMLDASIGVYDREKQNRQRVRINLDLAVYESAQPLDDKLENVLCYKQLIDKTTAIVNAGHINLVETLAERIADAALAYADVRSVQVRVEKLDVVENAASVGVAIERDRPSKS